MASSGSLHRVHEDLAPHHVAMLDRLTFFSDAVFAIAMTLLVIEVRLPVGELHGDAALGRALVQLIPHYLGYLISFLVIGRFWIAHHRLMGSLHRSDPTLVWANLVLLLAVAFMPFPTELLSEYVTSRVATAFYAGWLTVIGVLNAVLHRVALRPALMRPDADPDERQAMMRGIWQPILLGALGFGVALVKPAASPVVLIVAGPIMRHLLVGRLERKLRRRDEGVGDGELAKPA